jgi:hypothetical protein
MIKGDVLLNDIDKMIERDIAWGAGRRRHFWDFKYTNEKPDDPFVRLFHYCFKLTLPASVNRHGHYQQFRIYLT